MTPETWERIDEIFNAAADLPADERGSFLDRECRDPSMRARVERMLTAEFEAGTFLETSVVEAFAAAPATIGPWRIEREIGRGGMGMVYLAENASLGKTAALKIIRAGVDSELLLRRFGHERRILASLEHPNIARLIDAGTTDDGRPFYAMEYVEGVPLDEYCRGRGVREVLDIFRQICRAVAYAHARLVVHRDIKPSNILVDADGTAKLLDFGIAKVVSNDPDGDGLSRGTATALGMMTPDYASPEQIRGERVTTASDIYSLGVVLYELLAGCLPLDLRGLPFDRAITAVTETEPRRPSAAANPPRAELRPNGDLDNIVLKALRKEPDRRYQSARDLGDDILNYLRGLPVTARPPTFRYRASKFVGRNRAAVVAATFVLLSLVAGISVATWQAVVARQQKALAERRFADVRELANKVVFRYHDEIAKYPGATALREELVNDAVRYLDRLNDGRIEDDELRLELARAYQKIADVQGRPYAANLGKYEEAIANYRKAVSILESSARDGAHLNNRRQLVQTLNRLASVEARIGIVPVAEVERALALQYEIVAVDPSDQVRNGLELAEVLTAQADHTVNTVEPRILVYRLALAGVERFPVAGIDHQHALSRLYQRLGTNYAWLGDEQTASGTNDSARESYLLALQFDEKMEASVRAEIESGGPTANLRRIEAGTKQNIGEVLLKLGRTEKGVSMLKANMEICNELLRVDPQNVEALIDVANAHESLALAAEKSSDFKLAYEERVQERTSLGRAFAIAPSNDEARLRLVNVEKQISASLARLGRRPAGTRPT